MPKVFNWQIKREMEYPYDAAYPDEQFAFVFNINRCIGCQTCTMSCKSTWTFSKGQEYMWWNNVETKPYGGYPRHWDVKILSMMEKANPEGQVWNGGTFEGKTVFEAAGLVPEFGQQRVLGYLPDDDEWANPNLHEDSPRGARLMKTIAHTEGTELPVHKTWFFYLQRICNHCSYPACLAACPRKALYKRKEDGIVLIDQERCRGYRKCVEACPYKKSMYRPATRTSEKCIGCYPRISGHEPMFPGTPIETRCMCACVGKIRLQGLVKIDPKNGEWKEDRNNPLYYMVKVAKIALPLYPQFGTEPNGYYIPPRWVPRPYLTQMFGPGVDHAIDEYTWPSRETLAVMQLFRAAQPIIFKYKIEQGKKVFETTIRGKKLEVYNDRIIGYDKKGRDVVDVRVEEEVYERPAKHANSI
ncbi:MAG TPA: 4Fe-4S dicluster domain-containing protein [Bdellovibrionota bacterium]|nr:4Fe-4S dicluster domain-containing protein [Bdellovibrionota bacterium]